MKKRAKTSRWTSTREAEVDMWVGLEVATDLVEGCIDSADSSRKRRTGLETFTVETRR